jgi:signal recognition particle subunit SRP54
MARRILGMGDVVALVEEVRKSVDVAEAEKLAKKVAKGKGFDFNDLKMQLQQLQKMGGMEGLLDKLPGGAAAAQKLKSGQAEQQVKRQIALIDSMTPRERRRPEIIDGSRRRRIAAGAGMQVQDVNRLLKQHMEMQKMMKKLGSGKLARMMGAMGGKFPGMPRQF